MKNQNCKHQNCRDINYILNVININLERFKDNAEIVELLEDMISELCLDSKKHDRFGNLIEVPRGKNVV